MQNPWEQESVIFHTQRLIYSFQLWIGKPLIKETDSLLERARRLFEAPFVVMSHGTQDDPIFNYGNRKALELWGWDWEELMKTPSRKTAELIAQEERSALLEQATRDGFINNYCGVRITSTGKRFRIDDGIIWTVIDQQQNSHGQAACFSNYKFLT